VTEKFPAARQAFGDIAPDLGAYTDDLLFGDLWLRPGLSPRHRSLVTVASLISLCRHNELPFHLERALHNGSAGKNWWRRSHISPSMQAGLPQ
jgi:4-carboxymuconolactone decarboxylase